MKSRAEVDAELAGLEALIPMLVAEYAPDELLEAFAGEAEVLIEHVPAEHPLHIRESIDLMLVAAELIPQA